MEKVCEESWRFIGCLAFSRGSVPLLGLCVYDSVTYTIDVYEFSDTLSFTNLGRQLSAREVSVVLIPESQARTLGEVAKLRPVTLLEIPRSLYDPQLGEVFVKKIKGDVSVMKFKREEKYFSLSSVAALVTYLMENRSLNIRTHFSDVNFLHQETRLFMAQKTVEDLELVESISGGGCTLFDVLRMTKTRMGARLLRRNIMEPLCNLEEIRGRHEFVSFLKENYNISALIERCLCNFVDADQLFSKLSKNAGAADKRAKIQAAMELSSLVYSIRSIVETFDANSNFLDNGMLMDLYSDMKDSEIERIYAKLRSCMDEKLFGPKNVLGNNQQYIFSLKEGLNPVLDVSRKIYFENLDDLERTVLESYPSGLVVLHYDPKKGYVLKTKDIGIIEQITMQKHASRNPVYGLDRSASALTYYTSGDHAAARSTVETERRRGNTTVEEACTENTEDVCFSSKNVSKSRAETDGDLQPQELIYLSKRSDTVFFTTFDVQKINSRLGDACEKIIEVSYDICRELLDDVEESCNTLRRLCERIALIDMLFSFYLFSQKHETTIPTFGDTFIFTESSNLFLKKQKTKKNSFYACDMLNFNIITGKNMSGKTTYAKQAAYNVILSQIGCPVNAKFASTRLFRSILTRFTNEDDAGRGLSTFGVELTETKLILDYATPESLVLVDELGRGTNTRDGMAFALTVSEMLIEKRCYVYFVTHFKEIIPHLEHYPTVNVLQGSNFRIFSGVSKEANGMELAAEFLPKAYIEDAKEFRKVLRLLYRPLVDVEFNNSYVQLAVRIMNSKGREENESLRREILGILDAA